MIIMSVPLGKLQVHDLNVRKNKEDAERTAAIEASILAKGLLEPLIAQPLKSPKGSYGVYAGGRRLRALQNLQARGEIPADYEAPIIVREHSDGEIIEISTHENVIRANLRNYEVYAAYRDAVDRGVAPEDLAKHFGQRQIYVDQILRLGRLHPTIFAELAGGRLSEDQARAYAATEDQALQLAIFERLKGSQYPHERGPSAIHSAMKVGNRDASRMLSFVGKKAYEAAGGRWERDLFEEAGDRGRIIDDAILARLVEEKLGAIRAQAAEQANRPFKFVDKAPTTGGTYGGIDYELKIDMRRSPLDDHQKQRKQLLEQWKAEIEQEAAELLLDAAGDRKPGLVDEEAELDQRYEAVTAELDQIQASRRIILPKKGDIVATLEIDAVGDQNLIFWFASRKAKKAAAGEQSAAPALPEGVAIRDAGNYGDGAKAKARIKDDIGLTQTAIEIARSLRRSLMRALLVENARKGGNVAIDYLVWSQLRAAVLRLDGSAGEVGAFAIAPGYGESAGEPMEAIPLLKQSRSQEIWEEAIALLKQQSFLTSDNIGGAFIDFQAAKPELKNLAAAVVAGLSLKRSMNADGYRIDVHDVMANATSRSHPAALREFWTPTAEFLDLLPKAKRLEQVQDMVESKTFAAWGKMKAADITDLVVRVMTGRSPSLKAAGVSAAKEWVHPILQFGRPNVLDKPEISSDREAA